MLILNVCSVIIVGYAGSCKMTNQLINFNLPAYVRSGSSRGRGEVAEVS